MTRLADDHGRLELTTDPCRLNRRQYMSSEPRDATKKRDGEEDGTEETHKLLRQGRRRPRGS